MKKAIFITVGVLAVGTLAFILYKHAVAPTFTVSMYNPIDGTGQFTWGGASGSLSGNSAYSAGFGWTGLITAVNPSDLSKGWTLTVNKNGKLYKTMTIAASGPYSI